MVNKQQLLAVLGEAMETFPELRLGQLLVNASEAADLSDVFHLSDQALLGNLRRAVTTGKFPSSDPWKVVRKQLCDAMIKQYGYDSLRFARFRAELNHAIGLVEENES